MKTLHVIRNDKQLYWTGDDWGPFADAEYFNDAEVEDLDVPIFAEVVPLWEIHELQFARLLAELQAAGAFTPDIRKALGLSMDLNHDELDDLIECATQFWDHSKAKV